MKPIVSIVLSVAFLVACNAFGKDAAKPSSNPYSAALAAVPAPELPAKAADVVARAKTRDRQAATMSVVQGAVGLNPAAAPAIVGAIARAVPDMAPVAAAAAAAEQPRQASAIAKAAAAAAPAQAAKIVTAVCRAVPNQYRNIALAVAQAVPGADKEILRAVALALPDLKPALDKALAGYSASPAPLADTLDQAARSTQATSAALAAAPSSTTRTPTPGSLAGGGVPMPRGPAVGPPYFGLTTTPTNVTTVTSGEVPPGGRNYAAP